MTDIVTEAAKPRQARKTKAKETAALAVITPELTAELERERATGAAYLAAIEASTIETPADMETMVHVVRVCKERIEAREQARASILDPLKAAEKAAKALLDPVIDFFKAAKKAAQDKIDASLAAQRAAQTSAQQQVQASGGEATPALLAVATGQQNLTLPEGMHERTHWTWQFEGGNADRFIAAQICGWLRARGVHETCIEYLEGFFNVKRGGGALLEPNVKEIGRMVREHPNRHMLDGILAIEERKVVDRS